MIRADTHAKNDALDALEKIKILTEAALFLTHNDTERDAQSELIGVINDLAIRVLEASR
ncbi:hypothetical protein [Erwinia pyrifoliae]|uniref:hypothetical protein n=1 Tax=Erwinia pyrifoliae TaxID=79967 RepID=UPI0001C13378|nr:hypothetical protein [Erwinia pyrifoliae]CAY72351.1 hypothetical protein EPYR_00062 [Erwinia pyrifoliae DSM 12163]